MPDPTIRAHQTLTVINSNFLQLGRRSGGRCHTGHSGQFTPDGYLSTVIHTTLAGIEPTTFRLLVRRATSIGLLRH